MLKDYISDAKLGHSWVIEYSHTEGIRILEHTDAIFPERNSADDSLASMSALMTELISRENGITNRTKAVLVTMIHRIDELERKLNG